MTTQVETNTAQAVSPTAAVKATAPVSAPTVSFFKTHEKLLISILIVAATLILGNRWLNERSKEADASSTVAQVVAKQQADQVASLVQVVQQNQQQYQADVARWAAQNQALLAQISARNQQTTKEQKTDQTLPAADLAGRWQTILKLPANSVLPSASGFSVTDPAARQTVEQLEFLPGLTDNVTAIEHVVENKDGQITSLTTTVDSFQKEVDGLNTQIKDNATACTAQVAALKAAERKSKRNWFLRGLAIGAGVAAYILK